MSDLTFWFLASRTKKMSSPVSDGVSSCAAVPWCATAPVRVRRAHKRGELRARAVTKVCAKCAACAAGVYGHVRARAWRHKWRACHVDADCANDGGECFQVNQAQRHPERNAGVVLFGQYLGGVTGDHADKNDANHHCPSSSLLEFDCPEVRVGKRWKRIGVKIGTVLSFCHHEGCVCLESVRLFASNSVS